MDRDFLSAKIKAWRSAAGLTQKGFADLLGVSQQAVSYWESGHDQPSEKILQRIRSLIWNDKDLSAEIAFLACDPSLRALIDLDAAHLVAASKGLAVLRPDIVDNASSATQNFIALLKATKAESALDADIVNGEFTAPIEGDLTPSMHRFTWHARIRTLNAHTLAETIFILETTD